MLIEMATHGRDEMWHSMKSNGTTLCGMGRLELNGVLFDFQPVGCLLCINLVLDGRRPFLVEGDTLVP